MYIVVLLGMDVVGSCMLLMQWSSLKWLVLGMGWDALEKCFGKFTVSCSLHVSGMMMILNY